MTHTLPRVPFGSLPWEASRLGVGTYHLTSDRRVPRAEALSVLRTAVDLGINVFDTAPMYALGEAEGLLGEALGEGLRDQVLVNKIGRFEKSIVMRLGEEAYTDPSLMRAQFEHSLRTLGVDRVPVLLLHETDWDEWWPGGPAPVMEFVDQLRSEKLVDAVGLSVRRADRACELIDTGLFDSMLFVHYYNMVWQEAGRTAMSAAHDKGMSVMIGAPFRQGLLVSDDPALLPRLREERRSSVPPGVVDRIGLCQRVAREAGMSMVELGLRWLLSDERVHTVVVGPRTEAELRQNVEYSKRGALPPELVEELAAAVDMPLGEWEV